MEDPKDLITPQFATELSANYKNERANIINPAIGYDDATAIWYSIEALEEYITYVKARALELDYTANGIRFYLGVYPDDSIYGDKAKMTTVFLSPTGYENGGTPCEADICDIDPLNFGTMGNPPNIQYPTN